VTLLEFSWYHQVKKEGTASVKPCWSSQSVSNRALPYRERPLDVFFFPKKRYSL